MTTTRATPGPAARATTPAAADVGRLRLQRQCKCGATDSGLAGTCDECAAKRLQPKLAIGPADDRYEQEADRVAEAVLRAPHAGPAVGGSISPLVQRREVGGTTGAGPHSAVPGAVHAVLASSGRPLEPAARALFEPRFGHDFSRVRVHDDAAAAASARAVDAHAYTVGEHVVFGAGRYAPASSAGRRLLAHELTHVVQQQHGVLRRDAVSPRITGSVEGADETEPRRPEDEDENAPVQRLQRVPAIVGLDEAGPGADLSGANEGPKLAKIGECMKAKGPDPTECDPVTAPNWDAYARNDPVSTFGAMTGWAIRKKDVPSQQCVDEVLGRPTGPMRIFQGAFVPATSWVRPKSKDAADPAKNGSVAIAAQCRADLDAAAARGVRGAAWSLVADGTCAASPPPPGTKATKNAECDSKMAPAFTAWRIAESARLLKHEQTHFDIGCTLAKRANGLLWRGGDFAAIDAVLGDTVKATHTLYDGETHNGCDAAAQAKWQTAVAKGLPDVKLP